MADYPTEDDTGDQKAPEEPEREITVDDIEAQYWEAEWEQNVEEELGLT